MIIFNVEVGTTRPAEFRYMIEGIRDGIKSALKDEPFMIVPTFNGVGKIVVANGEGKVAVHNIDKKKTSLLILTMTNSVSM